MKQHSTRIASRSRTRIFLFFVVLYGVLMLYDITLSLHQSYPRMNAEGLANLLFSIAFLSWLTPRLRANQTIQPPSSRWYAVQIDCLLISLALLCYAVYCRLVLY
jgi:hypothetical protein